MLVDSVRDVLFIKFNGFNLRNIFNFPQSLVAAARLSEWQDYVVGELLQTGLCRYF